MVQNVGTDKKMETVVQRCCPSTNKNVSGQTTMPVPAALQSLCTVQAMQSMHGSKSHVLCGTGMLCVSAILAWPWGRCGTLGSKAQGREGKGRFRGWDIGIGGETYTWANVRLQGAPYSGAILKARLGPWHAMIVNSMFLCSHSTVGL